MKARTLGVAAILSIVAAAPAMAHHSFAMFDNDKTITLTGTVKEFEFVNPHSWIHIAVVNKAGVPEDWAFEMGSPGMLANNGWRKDTLHIGDKITISARPMRDGSHGGSAGIIKDAKGNCVGRCGGKGLNPGAPGGATGTPGGT